MTLGYSTRNGSLCRIWRIAEMDVEGENVVWGGSCCGGAAVGVPPVSVQVNVLPTTITSIAPLAYGASLGVMGPVRAPPPNSFATCFAASFECGFAVS